MWATPGLSLPRSVSLTTSSGRVTQEQGEQTKASAFRSSSCHLEQRLLLSQRQGRETELVDWLASSTCQVFPQLALASSHWFNGEQRRAATPHPSI